MRFLPSVHWLDHLTKLSFPSYARLFFLQPEFFVNLIYSTFACSHLCVCSVTSLGKSLPYNFIVLYILRNLTLGLSRIIEVMI